MANLIERDHDAERISEGSPYPGISLMSWVLFQEHGERSLRDWNVDRIVAWLNRNPHEVDWNA